MLHHFGSKEGLLIALLEDRDAKDRVSIGFSKLDDSLDALTLKEVRDLLNAAVVRNCAQPELIRLYAILQAEALNAEHPAYEFFHVREMAFIDKVAGFVSSHVSEPRSTARQLLALMLGLEQQWLRSGQAFDLVVEWERSVGLILPD